MYNLVINEYHPNTVSHPGKILEELIEERNITVEEIAELIDDLPEVVNEIIEGKASIDIDMANRLEKAIGIPATFWINSQRLYDESILDDIEEGYLPVMRNRIREKIKEEKQNKNRIKKQIREMINKGNENV